jgi:hypothetical protein
MRNKLKLDIDSLTIASFNTTDAATEKPGTVVGNATPCTFNISGCVATYHTCASFDRTC